MMLLFFHAENIVNDDAQFGKM